MAYLTEAILRANSFSKRTKSIYLENKKEAALVSIFLSHSHKDREIVEGFINLLARQGVSIYVDWQDPNMPRITSRYTAEQIKKKIYELDIFMVLATRNGMQSLWVPWEIGVADGRKKQEKIVVVPVADPSGQFHGNEYLQIYQRIEIADSGALTLIQPKQLTGRAVKSWLQLQ